MPVGPTLYSGLLASIANQTVPKGKTSLGLLYCAESQSCTDIRNQYANEASGFGMKLVYEAKISLAQPDFTAECLSAQRSGTEVLLMVTDSNSLARISASCARQDWHPQYATLATIAQDRHKNDPNLDGLVSSSATVPYFRTDTAATAEFHAVVKNNEKTASLGSGLIMGWVSGKLLERAGVNLAEPPTTAAILEGLWTVKDDTLGGLTIPLTFRQGQKPLAKSCWYDIAIANRRWISVDNYQQHCR
jgi:branched-chain amino acid transport system substrate-binding protein